MQNNSYGKNAREKAIKYKKPVADSPKCEQMKTTGQNFFHL